MDCSAQRGNNNLECSSNRTLYQPGLAAGLVEQAPGHDGRILAVQPAVEAVAPHYDTLHVVAVQAARVRVAEK